MTLDLSQYLKKHSGRGNGSYYYIEGSGPEAKILQTKITQIKANLKARREARRPEIDLEDYLFDYFPPKFRQVLEAFGIPRTDAYQFMEVQAPAPRIKVSTPATILAAIIAKGIPRRVKEGGQEKMQTGSEQVGRLVSLLGEYAQEAEALLDAWANDPEHGINVRGYINVQQPRPVIHKEGSRKRKPKGPPPLSR